MLLIVDFFLWREGYKILQIQDDGDKNMMLEFVPWEERKNWKKWSLPLVVKSTIYSKIHVIFTVL